MPRIDAQRNLDALLTAAKEEFTEHGVEVNVRAIAARAGVGTATLYRHFPLRSDLVKAVFRREVDAAADAAPALIAAHEPVEALTKWIHRYTEFIATKRGLAAALHSGDPAFEELPAYFMSRFGPTLQGLLDAASAAGEIRDDVDAEYLLHTVANLAMPLRDEGAAYSQKMIMIVIDGLRFGAPKQNGRMTEAASPV